MPTFGSLFAGIGGLDLGLERAGWTCRWQVENDPFCTRVLRKHWPDVARYGDIVALDPERLERVDLICGGFPCQPVSVAGKRLGQADARWLWPEFSRIIRALRPRLVLVENVPGLLVRGFGDVLGDLAQSGYDAEWDCVPAAAVGAPHWRDRVFVIAYPKGAHDETRLLESGRVRRASLESRRLRSHFGTSEPWRYALEPQPRMVRVADGVSREMDARLRALGNAVVPQVAEWIGRRLMETLR